MTYIREEQETVLVFDNVTRDWRVYTSVPKHIRKLLNIKGDFDLEIESGRPISISGTLDEKYIHFRKTRTWTDEQRQEAADRLARRKKEEPSCS